MRYMLYEADEEKVELDKETEYLQSYIDLQQQRFGKNLKLCVSLEAIDDNYEIEPMLLIPFVENAFKHISHNNDKTNFVKLDMSRSNGTFLFTVENSREAGQPNPGINGGIGLTNVKRRLELLYPGKHELMTEKRSHSFFASMQLNFDQP